MNLQELLSKASDLKKNGKHVDAFKMYSEAFDLLVKEANAYAGSFENTGYESIEDGKKVWTDTPAFFEKAEEYMKRDKTAAVISNNMGVILAELGDAKGAKKWFEQAVELTPNHVDYPDPAINLKNIKDKQDDKIDADAFSAALRQDFIITKKNITSEGDTKKHYCETCKKKLKDEALVAMDKEFCSEVCYLRYWKEERPNFGGNWITDENLKELEQLTGQARENEYNRIVSFLLNNFDANYIMLGLRYGDNRAKPKDKLDELNKWASKLSLDEVNNLSEDKILDMAMERPGHPGQYGFMLQMHYFKSKEHFAETMHALLTRLQKIENLKERMKNRI